MKNFKIILIIIYVSFLSCKKGSDNPSPANPEQMYFPPNNSTNWETKPIASLGWKQNAVEDLKKFLAEKNSKSFIILVNGRIVLEEYFNGHTSSDTWQWNSAGKTLVATTTGIAQQEGFLNIGTAANQYLGTGWTSEPLAKENLITVKHLLTMTSGLDESSELVTKSKLTYIADAGTRWAYANVFQKLMDVVSAASKQSFETYFNNKLKSKIGMDGFWDEGIIFKIYNSNTRSMAKFGLLALNNGKWNKEQIINESFFSESINSSQNINPSYGYLWWLNGKSSYMIPGSQSVFQGALVPNAPSDMYAAMGASDQRIYVIPSKNMVIVRMGNASDPANPSFAISGFDNSLWQKINAVIN
ncbi:serine hydrolase domain-containing protein [Pedobacter mendelii]|uniref:Serine hydrolase n=1 Tax=Pedobacter mendelii TaxID=1908240 RepID=A0ABQ2BJI4_9SPHI|nr:serine hydrolase [Pedobacter mendelii]GGI25790.1 serine hydrolase [Pedobacter mendelii]